MRSLSLYDIVDVNWTDDAKAQGGFRHMNGIAMDAIKNNVSDYYLLMIENETDAQSAWKALRQHFEGSRLVQATKLMRNLAEMIQEEDQQLERVLISFKNLIKGIKELCPNFPEILLTALLAVVVPKNCESTFKHLLSTKSKSDGDPEITLDQAVTLFQNELHLRSTKQQEKVRSLCAMPSAAPVKELRCLYCQEVGHPLKLCKEYKKDVASGQFSGQIVFGGGGGGGHRRKFKKSQKSNDKNENSSNQSKDAQTASASGTSAAGSAAGSSTGAGNKKGKKTFNGAIVCGSFGNIHPDRWYLDSGCADRHVARSLKGCFARHSGYESPIYVADDRPLPVSGSGDYRFDTSAGLEMSLS